MILDHMRRLVAVEAGLTITDPIPMAVSKAYLLSPSRQQALTDMPCWINDWEMTYTQPYLSESVFGGQGMLLNFTVHSQFFVRDADLDRGALIATNFFEAFLEAVTVDMLAPGNEYDGQVRGGLKLLEWAGQGYPGLDLFVTYSWELGT